MINIKRYLTNRLNDVSAFFTKAYVENTKLSIGVNKSEERNPKIIASLTSYPARFDILSVTKLTFLLERQLELMLGILSLETNSRVTIIASSRAVQESLLARMFSLDGISMCVILMAM